MVEPSRPGPGRSTSEAAITELKKEIASRNEEAQKAARKKRASREKEHLANLRKWNEL
jgi:F0F1-type ATP synthase assembly protein I